MDWKPFARYALRAAGNQLISAPRFVERLKGIRLICLDLDGVLTDGCRTYHADGTTSLAFDVRDGLGVYMLTLAQIEVALVSNGTNDIVMRRAAELGIRHVAQGVDDKAEAVRAVARELDIPLEARLYVADDVWDIPAFEEVAFRVAVAGALPQVVDIADAVTANSGGRGAVREVADAVLQAQGYGWRELLHPSASIPSTCQGEEEIV